MKRACESYTAILIAYLVKMQISSHSLSIFF